MPCAFPFGGRAAGGRSSPMTTGTWQSPSNSPDSLEETLARAEELLAGGREQRREARQLLEERLRTHPNEYPALDIEARLLVEEGEATLAERLLEEFIRYHPDMGEAAERLAWVFWRTHRREEALAELRAALARQPGLRRARRWLIEWAPECGKPELALEAAHAGLAESPDDPEVLLLAARSAEACLRFKEAEESYRRVLAMEGHTEQAIRDYGRFLLNRGRREDAVKLIEPLLGQGEASLPARLLAAEALLKTSGREEEGMALLQQLVFSPDAGADFYRSLLKVLYECREARKADKEMLSLVREHPVPDEFLLELASRFAKRHLHALLRSLWALVSAQPARYPHTVARFLTKWHRETGRPSRIQRWIVKHWAEIDSNPFLWAGVGAWYAERGKWAEAVFQLQTYAQRAGVKPWMVLTLARSCEALGLREEANQHLRHAVALEPDESEVAIRSRLAFNLALEGMPGAGQLILLDCSEKGRERATPADFVRIYAVESLAEAKKHYSPFDKKDIFDDTIKRMKTMAASEEGKEAQEVIRAFRKRVRYILFRGVE